MSHRNDPSVTKMLLTLGGIVAGVIVAVFAIGWLAALVAGTSPAQASRASAKVATPPAKGAAIMATTAPVARPVTALDAAPVAASTKASATRRPAEPTALVRKGAAAPAPARQTAAAAKHVAALPDRLKTLGGARQVVVVTTPNKDTRDGTLTLWDLGSDGNWRATMSATTRVGKNGLVAGADRHQGSAQTPTGSWVLPSWGFGKASSKPSGARIGWNQIRSTSYWSSESGSTYNTWVDSSGGVSGEHLINYADESYEFAINSGYNAPPNTRVEGRGTAIFIHCMHPGYTQGCISIPRESMVALLQKLDPSKGTRCVIGTADSGSSTSLGQY